MRSKIRSTNSQPQSPTLETSENIIVKARRGRKPRPVVEFPEPLVSTWIEPDSFDAALALHMRRHGDTCQHLHKAIVRPGERFDRKTLQVWAGGLKAPVELRSFDMLARIERRYRLPDGYFKSKLPHPGRASRGHKLLDVTPSERRRLAWHLPDDFDRRPKGERDAILAWVRDTIISGSTDYRRFQAESIRHKYSLRFPALFSAGAAQRVRQSEIEGEPVELEDRELLWGVVDAPDRLAEEMRALVAFKSATLTEIGLQRNGVWGEETVAQKIEHLGLMFGALAASPRADISGRGVPLSSLTFAILVFPQVWDWYVQWRERRRGFYTRWEVEMLNLGLALVRADTGWLRQNPRLTLRLRPISGLISAEDIERVQADWPAACDNFHRHGLARVKEIARVARVHRDPFEPILPVLECDSPVREYLKIAEEVLRLMPDARRRPREAAEANRAFLMLRLGLHLGLRQKNLRQLLFCPRTQIPKSERQLESLKRGELRWSARDEGWEVLIPSAAFKNASSSFFAGKPFRLVLPDLGGLYDRIGLYARTQRSELLGDADDPGTFFVKTTKVTTKDAAYDQTTFYEAWRLIIQRYGVFNPYTGRGAIKGLLPHGPHNVRDVLATHILKQTGSYEQASYAIQDTPDMVAKHYGRFLPQDKAAVAAQVLNRVWEAA